MSSSSKKKKSNDKVPTKIETNIDLGDFMSSLYTNDFEDFQKYLESPTAQTIIQYNGRPFPKDELIKRHRKLREDMMKSIKSGLQQVTFKNKFIQYQMKPELEMGNTKEYMRIFVKDLVVGTTHRKKVLRAKIVEQPVVMDAIHIIVEDIYGDVVQVSVYNTGIKYIQQADKLFQVGYELSVYDPFMKVFVHAGVGIRVDNPKEIYVGPPRPDFLNFDYKKEGNLCFKQQNFQQALNFYTLGLKNNSNEVAKLLGNISACLIKKEEFLASLLYAYSSVGIDEFYEKGWFRISNALKELGRMEELQNTFEFAPIEIQKALQIKISKNKNNKQQPIHSFFCSRLSDFVQNKSKQISGSFEELKTKGNDFFRNQEFSKALDYYLNALDLENHHVSTLLKNCADCYLNLNEFLNAAVDASASFMLQQKNNEKALHQRASALREMGHFELAIQSLQSEQEILKQSQLLQKLELSLQSTNQKQLPKVKNTYKSKKTLEDNLKQFNNRATGEQLQELSLQMNFLPKQEREIIKNLSMDPRIPNFYKEYTQEGHLPPHCDQKQSNKWLLQAKEESYRVTNRFNMEKIIYKEGGDIELNELLMNDLKKRLGNDSLERYNWWCEAEFGDVNFMKRIENYPKELLHSFSNVWPHPIDLTYGTVHVAVGYADLGQLLTADFYKEESDTPLQFIGYEQSVYCTAKSLIIGEMLKEKICPKVILQVWYSSGWQLETLEKFRSTVEKLIKNNTKLEKEIIYLFRYWLAAPRVSLLESQKQWLKFHPEHDFLSANMVRKEDRIEITTYLLTGRLLECEVGSVIMFANPPSYPHLSYDEKVTWLLKEQEIADKKEKFSTIIENFTGVTIERIEQLSEKISCGKIQLDLRLKGVLPNDKKIHQEIKNLNPYTMSWSNLVDYFGVQKFHQMAKACSAGEDTVHFVHSMNWVYDVKGAMCIDYPFELQYEYYQYLCSEGLEIQELFGFGDFCLLPPVDNPRDIVDAHLALNYSQIWAKKFYQVGGVIPKCVAVTISFPHSIFSKSQGNLYMKYTYDTSISFIVNQVESKTDEKVTEELARRFYAALGH